METKWGTISRERVDAIMRAKHQDADANLDAFGLTESDWPEFVSCYNLWIEEGKRLADFVVAYGFPPDDSDETKTLLSLVIPYARALRSRQAAEDYAACQGNLYSYAYMILQGHTNPAQAQAEAMARSMLR